MEDNWIIIMNINKYTIFVWGMLLVGLILINIFPMILLDSYSGFVLAMGIILFVNGSMWLINDEP